MTRRSLFGWAAGALAALWPLKRVDGAPARPFGVAAKKEGSRWQPVTWCLHDGENTGLAGRCIGKTGWYWETWPNRAPLHVQGYRHGGPADSLAEAQAAAVAALEEMRK